MQHLPSDPESFFPHRPHEDRRRGLDGQRAKAAALGANAVLNREQTLPEPENRPEQGFGATTR